MAGETSVSLFKARLHQFLTPPLGSDFLRINSYSKMCHGRTGRLITQFHLGLSPLHFDLYSCNISPNPFCPSCDGEIETINHFFLIVLRMLILYWLFKWSKSHFIFILCHRCDIERKRKMFRWRFDWHSITRCIFWLKLQYYISNKQTNFSSCFKLLVQNGAFSNT